MRPGEAGNPVTVTDMTSVAVARFVPSLPVMVKVVVGSTAVGVPLTTPVEVLRTSPVGSAGEIVKVRVAPSVVAVRAEVGVTAVPTRPATDCVTGTICPAAVTVSLTVATPKFAPSDTTIT